MSNLINYNPTCTIHLKDWTEIDVPENYVWNIIEDWKAKKIITIWKTAIDTVMISRITDSFMAPDLKSLTNTQKAQLKDRQKKFKDNLNREPTDEVIYVWCEKLKKWLSI